MNPSQTSILRAKHGSFLFFLLALLATSPILAQMLSEAEIQKKSRHVPFWVKKRPKPLARYLTKGYTDETSKALAISTWITQNIRSDYKVALNRELDFSTSFRVIRKRKALCGGYAVLFKDLCTAAGLQAEVVPGYTYAFDFFGGDSLYRTEHAWSVLKTTRIEVHETIQPLVGQRQPDRIGVPRNVSDLPKTISIGRESAH